MDVLDSGSSDEETLPPPPEAITTTRTQGRRRKRGADAIDYHKNKSVGLPDKIRIPTRLFSKWQRVQNHLRCNNTAVLDWLFEKSHSHIQSLPVDPIAPPTANAPEEHPPAPMRRSSLVAEETWSDLDDDPDILNCNQVPGGNSESTDTNSSEDIDDIAMDDFLEQAQAEYQQSHEDIPHLSTQTAFLARSKLKELFIVFKVTCPQSGCGALCDNPIIHDFFMCFSVSFNCSNGHKFPWISGDLETMRHSPEIVPRLYNAILCAGLSCTQLREICAAIGLHEPSKAHFYDFQRGKNRKIGWIDAVMNLWNNRKALVQEEMSARQSWIVVYLDARFDSSRSGYHGTAPILDKDTGMVIEMVTRTRVECGNSWRIEDQVIREGLDLLKAKGVKILEAVHDDKTSVDSILVEFDILSQKDMWHKAKKLSEKFTEVLVAAKKPSPTRITEDSTADQIYQMTNAKLAEFCKAKKLRHTGRKEQLLERVLTFMGMEYDPNHTPCTRGSAEQVAYPEFSRHDLGYKFKSWFYACCIAASMRGDSGPELLVKDLKSIAPHWAGDHSICRDCDLNRKCVKENWRPDRRYFAKGSESYKALEEWLRKNVTLAKMKFYTRARENFLSETFHSLINKYATKRIHWRKSHEARLACTALDWNENRNRECIRVVTRKNSSSAVSRRPGRQRILSSKTTGWKEELKSMLFDT